MTKLEDEMAPAVQRVISNRRPPPRGTLDRAHLLGFVAFQHMRTASRVAEFDKSTHDMLDVAMRPLDSAQRAAFLKKHGSAPGALAFTLRMFPDLTKTLADLRMAVIVADPKIRFVTSDNPVFIYNQYCEGGPRGIGTLGFAMAGFQLFLPLSPDVLLLLFDGDVYKVGQRGSEVVACKSARDAAILNGMQVLGAERNLLFTAIDDTAIVAKVALDFARLRAHKGMHVGELAEVENGKKRLIRLHEAVPNLKLSLSFVSVRRGVRALPIMERLRRARPGAYEVRGPRELPPGLRPGMEFREVEK